MQLRRLTMFAGLVLIGATWRLWTPQTIFPRVPSFRAFGSLPAAFEWVCFVLLVAATAVGLCAPELSRARRTGLVLFVIALVGMALADQHRLQPWAYQFAIVALILSVSSAKRGLALLRLLVISIYFHSALSKCDYSFLHTQGQTFLSALVEVFGGSTDGWPIGTKTVLAGFFPVGEFLVAIGLCIPRCRRWALYAAIIMHLLLILIVGPWGLGHKPGVLIWNLYFIGQDLVLFSTLSQRRSNRRKAYEINSPRSGQSALLRTARAGVDMIVVAVLLLPFLEPFGRFDVWPSWGLYATKPERVNVFVDSVSVERLPESLKRYVGPSQFADDNHRFYIDRWSFDALNVPLYPQSRFQVGVALALAEKYELAEGIRIEIETAADRWTGKRDMRRFEGVSEIPQAADGFVLNSRPRF